MRVGSGVQTDATAPNNVGTCCASWEEYLTIIPLARMGSDSIAHEAESRMGY